MKKILSKREQAIREAFQVYDAARVQSVKMAQEERDEGKSFQMGGKGTDSYVGDFQENMVEDKIYHLIQKLPMEHPRKKARKIWLGGLGLLILCALAGCLIYYVKEKPTRMTKALQEVYLQSGERMEQERRHTLVTEDGLMYQCHCLTKKEEQRLKKEGVAYKKLEKKVSDTLSEDNVQVYQIAGRESCQFILVKDSSNQISLGKFIGYQYWQGVAVTDYDGIEGQERERYGTRQVLEKVLGIYSPEDIRSVTFERSQPLSKDDSEKMVAMWTNKEGREWFYQFFSGDCEIWNPSPAGEETAEEMQEIKEEGMPITCNDSLYQWESQVLEKMPEKAFYLGIENRLHETLVLGVVLEEEKVELWIEPMEEGSDRIKGVAAVPSQGKGNGDVIQVEKRKGVLRFSTEEQKNLSEVLQKALDTE